jgi:hypothetical protein
MRPEGTPPLDAHSLGLQIEAVLPVVEDLAQTDPDREITGRILGSILAILAVIRQQYGSRLILDTEIGELLMTQAPAEPPVMGSASLPEPITAIEMRLALASVRASLLALAQLEARTTPYDPAATAEASQFWTPDADYRDSPPGGPRNWREGPGDRQYRITADRQQGRTAMHRPSGLPW